MEADAENKVISKFNTGFPGYLNFEKLRADAIAYLGNLSGKIWTDHNVHDPGITILETLIYAIMDLGYRNNLPVADLLARDPEDKTADNNFFGPAKILGNNPLTITDYRKLLVDLVGVKNAWLEIDNKTTVNFCGEKGNPTLFNRNAHDRLNNLDDCHFLNGLYHVYIQAEQDAVDTKHKQEKLVRNIKEALMSHRNFCEDFVDIKILCSLEIGICADFELEKDADPKTVYIDVCAALSEYFSPSPKFYTFQQLLDKGRTVDEIFAGRPYNLTQSHGFVDAEEFEQLTLRRVLNLSDVYHLLFDLHGIKDVRRLGWIRCCDDKRSDTSWQLRLPEDHIAEFSPKCSGFTFSKASMPIPVDANSFESAFKLRLQSNLKGLYHVPSPYLEPAFPLGNFRADLASYFSIQNEFPRVYGISEGGLEQDATLERKAKARQLQSFLLFFDQLLANYLAQLKNIRSLYSFSSSKKREENATYFINKLNDVPYFSELVRFRSDDDPGNNAGNILAYPTDYDKLNSFVESGAILNSGPKRKCNDGYQDDFPEYTFCFDTDRDLAIRQILEDMRSESYAPHIVKSNNNCYFFYIITSSSTYAIISKNYYSNEQEAKNAATSVQYTASFKENFRPIVRDCDPGEMERFSFDIELNLNSYSNYLQLIVEDDPLYYKRRKQFLSHLLARFAERFTDYALLSSPYMDAAVLHKSEIQVQEMFLQNYDNLSSKRGQAYNYLADGWNNDEISGFERRFEAVSGIQNWKAHDLCNFIVRPADLQYRLTIELFGKVFILQKQVLNKDQALNALTSVHQKLVTSPELSFNLEFSADKWQIYLTDGIENRYYLAEEFSEKNSAEHLIAGLEAAIRIHADKVRDVRITSYIYQLILFRSDNLKVAESHEKFPNAEQAKAWLLKIGTDAATHLKNKNGSFTHSGAEFPSKLLYASQSDNQYNYINEDDFIFKPFSVYHLKTEKKRFTVLNKLATIQFDSLVSSEDLKLAKAEYRNLLKLLISEANYAIEKDQDDNVYKIYITDKSKKSAVYFENYQSWEEAKEHLNEILTEVKLHSYNMGVSEPIPARFEFKYSLNSLEGESVNFESADEFHNEEQAWKAAQYFYAHITDVHYDPVVGELELPLNSRIQRLKFVASPDESIPTESFVNSNLRLQKKAFLKLSRSSRADYENTLENYRVNKDDNFFYELVNKDHPIAEFNPKYKIKSRHRASIVKDELLNHALKGYDFLQLALGGAIVKERVDIKTRIKWYHFLIKAENRYYQQGAMKGEPLIFFESSQGYRSAAEALKAFQQKFPEIIKIAGREASYGITRAISLKQTLIHNQDFCSETTSFVFIPDETLKEFNDYEVQRHIVPLIQSFPLRFYAKDHIKFVFGRIRGLKYKHFVEDWRSIGHFNTISEAILKWDFFLKLLKYPGNTFIQWNAEQCIFEIKIREVLAVSAHGFKTSAEAWGAEGVEKFICVSQTENAFHHYWNSMNCSYSFYLACTSTGLIHPCSFETPKRRDHMLERLYSMASQHFFKHISFINGDSIILKNDEKDLVEIDLTILRRKYSICDMLLLFSSATLRNGNFIASKEGLRLKVEIPNDTGFETYIIGRSLAPEISLKEWKHQLRAIAQEFPIRKSGEKYQVKIAFPLEVVTKLDCGCPSEPADCDVNCHTAWESECCFDSCCQALEYYAVSLSLLREFENYKPVFDCSCGNYRIEVHPNLSQEGREKLVAGSAELLRMISQICNSERNRVFDHFQCLSEIVAINPQQYDSEHEACEASCRASGLINSEGLHIVEHILLRPYCKNSDGYYEDCQCDALPRPCLPDANNTSQFCHFGWIPPGDDPCEMENAVCFTPGYDPYSFLATVAMPAWPQRFRSLENRKILEKLLQKEAPAHVMLRILWLNPRSLCCFEYYFKLWRKWMANKLCDLNYSNCNFLEFLFQTQFESLSACKDCEPCGHKEQVSCSEPDRSPCADFNLYDQLNALFCWARNPEANYSHCEESLSRGLSLSVHVATDLAEPALDTKGSVKEQESIASKKDFFASRAVAYDKLIESLSSDLELEDEILDFNKRSKAEPEYFKALVEKIIRSKPKSGGENQLNIKQRLVENLIWKLLDNVYKRGKTISKRHRMDDFFRTLRSQGIDMERVYIGWSADEVKMMLPDLNIESLHTILTGAH